MPLTDLNPLSSPSSSPPALPRLIPSMDLRGGRVVRLRHGDPGQTTFYDLAPEAWIDQLAVAGAHRIHLVDLDGAFGRPCQGALRAFPGRHPGIRFQIGGGLRSRKAIQDAHDAGFDAVVGTLALEDPARLEGLPPERIVLALDLKEGQLALRGWQARASRPLDALCRELRERGFDTALVTDVGRDGTLEGPGTEAAARIAAFGFSVQASGGLRDLADLETLGRIPGVRAAISGKALLEGLLSLEDPSVRTALQAPEGGR